MTKQEVKKAIEKLYDLSEICVGQTTFLTHDDINAIRMGIASLKTDEAYQLEYENRDCVEVIRCKNRKYFEYDHIEKIDGVPLIVAHEMCTRWGNGCKTNENGYCHLGEKKEQTDG